MTSYAAACLRTALLAFLLLVTGCLQTGTTRSTKPQSDLLAEHYPDLASGRFAVIADFEDPGQADLFRIEPSSGAPPKLESSGIPDTGGHCLAFTLHSSGQHLVMDNTNGTTWLLTRHWQDYNLLLVNVQCPRVSAQLDLAVIAGDDDVATEAHSVVPLQKGWNLLRLDLNEASDYIALDDVRAIQFAVPNLEEPITLRVDDILLANNRRTVFGDPAAGDGAFYVVHEGRRLNVGTAGRFEIDFANGQIVRWYALDDDPGRVADLVGAGNVLGPMPTVLPDDIEDLRPADLPPGFASLGDVVVARQRLVEANAIRAVIEVSWRYGDLQGHVTDDSPYQRWTYTIYPTGKIYVAIECTTHDDDFRADNVGLVVSRQQRPGMTSVVHEAAGLDRDPAMRHVTYGCLTDAARRPHDLLCVVHDSRKAPRIKPVLDTLNRRMSLVAYGGGIDQPVHTWHCLLDLAGRSDCDRERCEAEALSYCDVPNLHFTVGGLDKATEGDADRDGFNERYGTLMLAPASSRVQLRLDGRGRIISNPAFCVTRSADRQVWVYVNYVVHTPVGRDEMGNAIFELGHDVTDLTTIEVYLRAGSPDTP